MIRRQGTKLLVHTKHSAGRGKTEKGSIKNQRPQNLLSWRLCMGISKRYTTERNEKAPKEVE